MLRNLRLVRSLISIAPVQSGPSLALLAHAGGFAWWYAELRDEAGNGAVLIWSWALPFLPGLASAARQGEPQVIGSRPSVNLAVYREGKRDAYWLEEVEPADATWDGAGHWSFGDSVITLIDETDPAGVVRSHLEARLSLRTPGASARLDATLKLSGPAARIDAGAWDTKHVWTPLTGPSSATFDGQCGELSWSIDGPAYLDRNHGTAMLDELGIDTWLWGHGVFGDEQRIAYILMPEGGGEPTAFGVSIDSSGNATIASGLHAELERPKTSRYGMPWWPEWTVATDDGAWLTIRNEPCVDSGPFYLRYLATATRPDGQTAIGSSEVIRPRRIDLAYHRPLVRMRVGHRTQPTSVWLPLFSGPRAGRVGRLLASWMGA
ncbi:MAG: carotenoid 1,2-hydratase [Bradymonadia bacterium]|jgi:carotenoid 1,2-hydratase